MHPQESGGRLTNCQSRHTIVTEHHTRLAHAYPPPPLQKLRLHVLKSRVKIASCQAESGIKKGKGGQKYWKLKKKKKTMPEKETRSITLPILCIQGDCQQISSDFLALKGRLRPCKQHSAVLQIPQLFFFFLVFNLHRGKERSAGNCSATSLTIHSIKAFCVNPMIFQPAHLSYQQDGYLAKLSPGGGGESNKKGINPVDSCLDIKHSNK